MKTEVLDGKKLAAALRAEVQGEVAEATADGHRPPGLAAVLVGEDPASAVYVRSKTRDCKEVGIAGRAIHLDAGIAQETLIEQIDELNADTAIDGILVQLPLPGGLDVEAIQERVLPEKDVDGFHSENVGRLWLGRPGFVPCTPAGIVELLRRYKIEMAGKHAVVLGRSNIVGKPMAALLLRENCTVTICHSRTTDLPSICRQADILVAAVGRTAMVEAQWVKPGAVVVDVGMNRITDPAELERLFPGNERRRRTFEKRGAVLTGDVDQVAVAKKAAALTPVPGGVGPLTRAFLLVSTMASWRLRLGIAERKVGASIS